MSWLSFADPDPLIRGKDLVPDLAMVPKWSNRLITVIHPTPLSAMVNVRLSLSERDARTQLAISFIQVPLGLTGAETRKLVTASER